MPESNAAAKRRQYKANRAAGIGDETGRVRREKEAPKMMKCFVCQHEMKITKTNTELKVHSESKHGKTLDECFPGAADIAKEMAAAVSGKSGAGGKGGGAGGMSKKQQKAKAANDMDDLLSAGLSSGKKKGKK